MRNLAEKLEMGESFFGSGGHNSETFNQFYKDFKKSLTRQLKRLNATEITMGKNHFCLSGFFKVGEQFYYFSLSDVRSGSMSFHKDPTMLFRTAKDNKDFSGGTNNFITVENKMYENIARVFNLEINTQTTSNKESFITRTVNKTIKNGFVDVYAGSMNKANRVAWKVDEVLRGDSKISTGINVTKNGKTIKHANCSTEQFEYYYDGNTKRITIKVLDKPFDEAEFLKGLVLPENAQIRVNPFTGDHEKLEPQAVALYDYIKKAEMKTRPLFQEALLIFRRNYSKEYMTLLD